MYSLVGYISERLNPRHLGTAKFPIDGTINDMVKFLKYNGFKEIKNDQSKSADEQFDEELMKGIITDDDPDRIWFADTSEEKISDDNPIFLIRRKNNITVYHYSDGHFDRKYDKQEFIEKLNNRFGF